MTKNKTKKEYTTLFVSKDVHKIIHDLKHKGKFNSISDTLVHLCANQKKAKK